MSEALIQELISKKILVSGKNRLQLFNQVNISMYGAKAWAFTLQNIGLKKNENYLYELGYLMGYDSAQELKEVLEKKKQFLPERLVVITNLIEMSGFGVIKINKYEPKQEIILEIIENHIIKYSKSLYGENSMICSYYAGVYSGFIQTFLDLDQCRLSETNCICKQNGTNCIFNYKQ